MERGSLPPARGWWHVAHATVPVDDICSSQNSTLPRLAFAVVIGLPAGTGGGGKGVRCAGRNAPAVHANATRRASLAARAPPRANPGGGAGFADRRGAAAIAWRGAASAAMGEPTGLQTCGMGDRLGPGRGE